MVPHTYEKDEGVTPFILSGSQCMQGSGVMVVCAVGSRSLQGKNQAKLSGDDDEKTPLQDKLELLANKIGLIGTYAAALTAAACSAHMIYEIIAHKEVLFE
jgi:P-type Ca2+ transporter type 2B